MSFTFNFFDERRTGMKTPYLLPRRFFIDQKLEWTDPFKWTADTRPGFLAEGDAALGELDAQLSRTRREVLDILAGGRGDGEAAVMRYHSILVAMQDYAAAARPTGEIDSSLPNFEQDRLIEERERHVAFESTLEHENLTLLYNYALVLARRANTFRFKNTHDCQSNFCHAAGVFDMLANTALSSDLPNELSANYLRILALCCVAGATENELMFRQVAVRSQWEACTHLSYSLHHYYSRVAAIVKHAKNHMDRAAGVTQINNVFEFATVKQSFYKGLACDLQSLQPGATKRQLPRLRKALKMYETALHGLSMQLLGLRKNVECELERLGKNARSKIVKIQEQERQNHQSADMSGRILQSGEEDLGRRGVSIDPVPNIQDDDASDVGAVESKRYEGATQSPTFMPQIPAWLHQEAQMLAQRMPSTRTRSTPLKGRSMKSRGTASFVRSASRMSPGSGTPLPGDMTQIETPAIIRFESPSDNILLHQRAAADGRSPQPIALVPRDTASASSVGGGNGSTMSASAVCVAPPKALAVELIMPRDDLVHKELEHRIGRDDNVIPAYHEIEMVARVSVDSVHPILPGFTMILVFDTWGAANDEGANKIGNARDVVMLLLRVVGLTDRDRVGVVGWVQGNLKAFEPVKCNAAGQDALVAQINALQPCGSHTGSGGSTAIDGVAAAVKGLVKRAKEFDDASSHEVFVFSDGVDSNSASHYTNWSRLHSAVNAHREAEDALGRHVRVHTFALGDNADKYLMKGIANQMRGDYCFANIDSNGLSCMRSWLLRHIADQRSKIATDCELVCQCAEGVTLRYFNEFELVFDQSYIHDHSSDGTSGTLQLCDFAEGHASNIIVVLGVPEALVGVDPGTLATFTLRYTNCRQGTQEHVDVGAMLTGTEEVICRERYDWLPQLYAQEVEGVVRVSSAGGGHAQLRAGDLVDPSDTVEVKNQGRAMMRTADGTTYALTDKSCITINDVSGVHLTASVVLRKGDLFIATGEGAQVDVRVLEPLHVVTVKSRTFVKVGIDAKTGMVNVNCMHGMSYITTSRADQEPTTVTVLPLRQTQMSETVGPITPWTLEEACYTEWIAQDTLMGGYLNALLAVGINKSRTVCGHWLACTVEWLRRYSLGQQTETRTLKRCREFLMRFWVRESKHYLTNNIAMLAPETDPMRKYIDRAIGIVMGADRTKRKDATAQFELLMAAYSLQSERSKGYCDIFDTELQMRLQVECADAKAREERDREAKERTRLRQLRDNEASRRERVLSLLFPLCDLDGVNVVYFTSVQQIILSIGDVAGDDPQSLLQETIRAVCGRWQQICDALDKARSKNTVVMGVEGLVEDELTGGLSFAENDFIKLWVGLTGECDTPAFNKLMEQVHGVVEELFLLNEGTRTSRALFSLFRKWDDGKGYIEYGDVFEVLKAVHGLEPYFVESLERFTRMVRIAPPCPVKQLDPAMKSKELIAMTPAGLTLTPGGKSMSRTPAGQSITGLDDVLLGAFSLEKDADDDWQPLERDFKVYLRLFHYGLAAFYSKFTERAFHAAVEAVAAAVQGKKKAHNQISRVIKNLQRDKEQEHLKTWDLRHVFDGITPKALRKLSAIPTTKAPAHVQLASAPVCILCGFAGRRRDIALTNNFAVDGEDLVNYWEMLKEKLERDAEGFIDFLRNFPVLSVTYRQVLRAMACLNSPDADSCRLMAISPTLAQLCDWVRIILKILFLEQGWDFTNCVRVLSHSGRFTAAAAIEDMQNASGSAAADTAATADVAAASPTRSEGRRDDEGVDTIEAIQQPGWFDNHRPIRKPHMEMELNRMFDGIVDMDDPVCRAESRISMYDDSVGFEVDEATGARKDERVALPDRKLNTVLTRTVPVVAMHDADGLPPHYVPRLDHPGSPDTVCSELHMTQYSINRAGRTPNPPSSGAATPAPGAYGVSVSTPTPRQPPRPASAPLGGRSFKRSYGVAHTPPPAARTSPSPPPARAAYGTPSPCKQTEVAQFLEAHGLEELTASMSDKGFDDLVDLRYVVENDHTIGLYIEKPGHRMKLKRLLGVQ